MRGKTKTNRKLHARIFPRFASGARVHVITSNSDWFTKLSSPSVVIGQSNCFGFDFKTAPTYGEIKLLENGEEMITKQMDETRKEQQLQRHFISHLFPLHNFKTY